MSRPLSTSHFTGVLRAVTLRHPWPLAIARFGKDIENRTWAPSAEQLRPGDALAIHGGKMPRLDSERRAADEDYIDEITEAMAWIESLGVNVGDPKWRELAVMGSAVVAVATYRGAVRSSSSRWFVGPVGWQLDAVRVLPCPVPSRGFQGLWQLPPAVAAAVRAQLEVSHVA